MPINSRLSARVRNLGEIRQFLLEAEALGHTDTAIVGEPGSGLKLWVDASPLAAAYECSQHAECKYKASSTEMLVKLSTGTPVMPTHMNNRQFTCNGTGKTGKPSS